MLEFYACFRSVYLVYADWELYIYDTEADKIEKILSGFQWSQDHEFTGPLWQRFSIDLDSYAGKKCTFSGFIDFWRGQKADGHGQLVMLTEPQLWYNLNSHLSIGTECEISSNFIYNTYNDKSFFVNPTLGMKWNF